MVKKMKQSKKAFAAVVCVALALCLGAATAFARNTPVNPLDMGEVSDIMMDAAASVTVEPSEGVEVSPTGAKTPVTATATDSEGNVLEGATYQWQILADENAGMWVNIQGDTQATCELTYGKVSGMLGAKGTAQVRCKAFDADGTEVAASDPVEVAIAQEDASAAESDNATSSAPARANAPARETTNDSATYAAGDGAATTYNVVINYVFENGEIAADPYTANLAAGSDFNLSVTFPIVQGYLPYLGSGDEQKSSLEESIKNIQANIIYTVTYKPTNVNYTVIRYQQNADNDNYTEVARETKQGLTKSTVPEVAGNNDYEGFYSLLYERPEIAADGSTVVEVYYDRYYYLMNFNLDGGYGVEPIYARYGTKIDNVGEPTKAGYTFAGWTSNDVAVGNLPATMPAGNRTYKAQWTPVSAVNYTVVFWYENADDADYSYAGSVTQSAAVGTSVSSGDLQTIGFTGRDADHFTYDRTRAETATVAGDGSTVVNVYFSRNTYTLVFKNAEKALSCGQVEHSHSDSCCEYGGTSFGHWSHGDSCCKLGLPKHSHRSSCYTYSDLTIIAKYQSDIHGNFPIKDGDETIWWTVPSGCQSFEEGHYLGSIDSMPGENITFTRHDSESGAKIYYYVETLNDAVGDTSYNGRNYKQYKVIDLDYSRSVNLTYKEEFHPIKGFTQGDSNPNLPVNGEVRMERNNYLYYIRDDYVLKFYNYNDEVTSRQASVQYEASLGSYDFTPDYPGGLEPNAYEFDGWYLNPQCTGAEYKLSEHTMPAGDLMLYAKWTPVVHTVKFYLDKNALDAGTTMGEYPDLTVAHGSKVESAPEKPTHGDYTFIGWFYMDGNTEKAFDFANMPVTKDMQVYGKWSSNVLKQYFVYYKIEDTDTEIAAPTTGSALAGTTKTFDAKGGTDLYENFQEGYFPVTKSHSMTIDIDNGGNNIYTFWYVQKDAVPYKVEYRDAETSELLPVDGFPEGIKTVEDNRSAVVTEKFIPISGYVPDAYQKRLVVSADDSEHNVIIFYYTKDNEHAYYKITHYTENLATDSQGNPTWTEYASSQAQGDIGTTYSSSSMTIPGFTYDPKIEESVASGELTANGLELKLYYTRNSYPYQVRYLEEGTGRVLHGPEGGKDKFGRVVSKEAVDISGYDCVNESPQTLTIRIEEGEEAKRNVITFYYKEKEVTFNYEVVGPDGCGTVSLASETVKVKSGAAQGSAATANDGFRFVGWYTDKACTQPVESTDGVVADGKFTPLKQSTVDDAQYTGDTYYAKFEYDRASLTITKAGWNSIDPDQSFIFEVKGDPGDERTKGVCVTVTVEKDGSVTLADLPVGRYEITEKTDWSWRYEPTDGGIQGVTLQPDGSTVTIANNRTSDKWFDGNAVATNLFNQISGN